jgi:hypothetical protein
MQIIGRLSGLAGVLPVPYQLNRLDGAELSTFPPCRHILYQFDQTPDKALLICEHLKTPSKSY